MRLDRLTLTDFRNYEYCVWEPQAPIAVLTGENGSGKTNLLEAVSLLTPGRGIRNAPLSHFYRNGARQWGVAGRFSKQDHSFQLSTGQLSPGFPSDVLITDKRSSKRLFLLDGQTIRNQSHVAALFRCVWLTPQMDRLFNETASGRRRFFDRLVMALYPDHASQMAAHERSVTSRNRLLSDPHHDPLWLDAIEESISRHAVAATAARLSFIERMNALSSFKDDFPETVIEILCPIAELLQNHPALYVEDWLRDKLQHSRNGDALKGSTSMGVHKSDFSLKDRLTQRSASLSSSGQQKLMLLGIILHHATLVTQTWGEAPFILLDEPLVHLDEKKRSALLNILAEHGHTVFITGTEQNNFLQLKSKADFFDITNGLIKNVNF